MEKEENLQQLVANNLIYYRRASGLTQLELANKLNYSDKSISKWERGEGFPDVFVLKALADFYGINVNDFYAKEHKVIVNKTNKISKHVYLQLLSVAIVWAVTLLTHLLLSVLLVPECLFEPWLVFLYGIIATGVVLIVWQSIHKMRFVRIFSVSLTIWSSAVSLYFTFLVIMALNIYLVFFLAIPLQILEIIWYLFRRSSHKNKSKDV